jgi:hypothetical protein
LLISSLAACAASAPPSQENPSEEAEESASRDDQSDETDDLAKEIEEYLLSMHQENNRLVYFFIEKDGIDDDSYAFILSDPMTDDEWVESLTVFTSINSPYPEEWYNEYCPVVIQDDYNAISMSAFDFPEEVFEVKFVVQTLRQEDNTIKNNLYPQSVALGEDAEQYYLITVSSDSAGVAPLNREEMLLKIRRVTNYATSLGDRPQLGYIKGKGQ